MIQSYNKYSESWVFTWGLHWVQPFESLISILSKFAIFNCMTLREAISCFYSQNKVKDNLHQYNSKLKIDIDRIRSVLGISINDILKNDIQYILPASAQDWLYVSDWLRYCPECLANGYHSYHYQLRLYDVCPVHNIELVCECIKCGNSIRCKLNKSVSSSIYCCDKCGYAFWTPKYDLPLNVISLAPNIVKVFDNNEKFLNTSQKRIIACFDILKYREQSNEININDDESLLSTASNVFDYWKCAILNNTYQMRLSEGLIYSTFDVKYIKVLKGVLTPGGDKSEYNLPQLKEFYVKRKPLIAIYKSIRRYFIKKYIGKHKKCAQMLAKAVLTCPSDQKNMPFCKEAVVLLTWRMYWEKNVNSEYIIFNSITKYSKGYDSQYFEFDYQKQIVPKMLALECYWTFLEALSNAYHKSCEGDLIWGQNLISGNKLPYWLIEEYGKDNIRLHTWSMRCDDKLTLIARSKRNMDKHLQESKLRTQFFIDTFGNSVTSPERIQRKKSFAKKFGIRR